jgi:hypothetical protein
MTDLIFLGKGQLHKVVHKEVKAGKTNWINILLCLLVVSALLNIVLMFRIKR